MAPDRFDDVDVRFLEEPEPERRPPSLRRRMAVAMSAMVLGAGVLAAGASALAEDGSTAAGSGKAKAAKTNADGVPFERSGGECPAGKPHRRSSSLSQSDF